MTPEELQEKFDQIANDTIADAAAVDCTTLDYQIGLQTIIDNLLMELNASKASGL